MDTDTDTDFLADFRARILARKSACPARAAAGRSAALAACSALSVGDARVYRCTCTVHDELSCIRLQNYTIGASLTDKSVSVSVLWNLTNPGFAGGLIGHHAHPLKTCDHQNLHHKGGQGASAGNLIRPCHACTNMHRKIFIYGLYMRLVRHVTEVVP